jgi:hypothetical protein
LSSHPADIVDHPILSDERGNVREAASEAISVLAKTSETSRSFMLPSLLHNLENPSRVSIPSLAQGILRVFLDCSLTP